MSIELSFEERDALVNLLERELVVLPVEIHRTDHRDYRVELEKRERILRGLQDRLAGAAVAAST